MPNRQPITSMTSNNCSPQKKCSISLPATGKPITPRLRTMPMYCCGPRCSKTGAIPKRKKIIVTYPQALFEKVISQHTLKRKTLTVKTGDVIGLDFVNETLFEYGFDRINFVTQPGEFSLRGGIIDVFSFAHQHPYRIEFFDDEIESLRSFDVNTQLSISPLDKIDLLPNTSEVSFSEKRNSLIDSLPKQSTVVFNQLDVCLDRIKIWGQSCQTIRETRDHNPIPTRSFVFECPRALRTFGQPKYGSDQ